MHCLSCGEVLTKVGGWANVSRCKSNNPDEATIMQIANMPAGVFAEMVAGSWVFSSDGNYEGPYASGGVLDEGAEYVPWHVECANCTTPIASWDVQPGTVDISPEMPMDPVMNLYDLVDILLAEAAFTGK